MASSLINTLFNDNPGMITKTFSQFPNFIYSISELFTFTLCIIIVTYYKALVSLFSTAAFMKSASLCSYCSLVLNTLTETQSEFTSFSPTISM